MPKLPKMVQALLNPKAYPENPPQDIELIQTQMSFVFLTDKHVYKIKKPVNLGFLDYTTLEKRRLCCHKEVKLNQRLCPDTYLGVVPITRNRDSFSIEGQGQVVEYAVKMRHLPQKAMMDSLLANNQVSPQMVADVARKLAEFHQRAATNARINTFGTIDAIKRNTDENFNQTEKYVGVTISREAFQQIKDYTNSFITEKTPLFKKRIADGRIRDCHGDLHAAHICFDNGICIYDCIEFNDRFRYYDITGEVGFLAMDLDHYGRADLSHSFVNAYVAHSRDEDLLHVLDFYKCYRAYVRGKVESFKLDDPHISTEEKERVQSIARSYFDLAASYV